MAISKKTLLEQAKTLSDPRIGKSKYTDEEVELALAWVAGEVSVTQVGRAMKMNSVNSSYPFLACALRQWMNNEGKK